MKNLEYFNKCVRGQFFYDKKAGVIIKGDFNNIYSYAEEPIPVKINSISGSFNYVNCNDLIINFRNFPSYIAFIAVIQFDKGELKNFRNFPLVVGNILYLNFRTNLSAPFVTFNSYYINTMRININNHENLKFLSLKGLKNIENLILINEVEKLSFFGIGPLPENFIFNYDKNDLSSVNRALIYFAKKNIIIYNYKQLAYYITKYKVYHFIEDFPKKYYNKYFDKNIKILIDAGII